MKKFLIFCKNIVLFGFGSALIAEVKQVHWIGVVATSHRLPRADKRRK
jgi:hypothetical protein